MHSATSVTPAERGPATLIHCAWLLGYLLPTLGHLLGPLAAWLYYRDHSPTLDDQGKEALNFQLSLTLYGFLLTALIFALLALGLLGGVASGFLGAAGSVLTGDPTPAFNGIWGMVLGVLGPFAAIFAILLPLALLGSLFPFITMIIALVRLGQGQLYRYPVTIRFLS